MRYSLLYIIALILVISQIFGFPGIVLAVLITLIISLLNTIDTAKNVEEGKESLNAKLVEIGVRVNVISQ